MRKYKTILFDLDGTLTDSAEGIINCAVYALEKMNRPVPEREWFRRFVGPPLFVSFTSFCGMDEGDARKAVELYRERYHPIGLFENAVYDGIEDTLKRLSSAGKTLAVATSKPEVTARRILKHFDLDKFFAYIGGPDLSGLIDTKSQVIEYVMKTLSADPSETLMIGDRFYDIEGARSVGIDSMGVLYGYGRRGELEQAGADIIAETAEDIADIILDKR